MNSKSEIGVWTWADMISSWRFWGLLIVYLLMAGLAGPTYTLAIFVLQRNVGLTSNEYGGILSLGQLGTALGFCLAWPAIKGRTRIWLIAMVAIKVAGLILLFHDSAPTGARAVGAALVGLSVGATLLTIPAVLAQGRGGADAFVVAFGVMSTIGMIAALLGNVAISQVLHLLSMQQVSLLTSVFALLCVAVLLSIDDALFNAAPPPRGYALPPQGRRPLEVALMFFIPFYGLYWLYRIHGEVTSALPSRTLLSPRAALSTGLFVPLLAPVAAASVIEVLNNQQLSSNKSAFRSPLSIFLWSLFFPPAAAAMIQSAFNEVMMDQAM